LGKGMRRNMFYIISYDIVETKNRTKIANILESCAVRVQKSVFEAVWSSKILYDVLEKIRPLIDEKVDSIRIYSLCGICKSKIFSLGAPSVYEDMDLEII